MAISDMHILDDQSSIFSERSLSNCEINAQYAKKWVDKLKQAMVIGYNVRNYNDSST